MSDKKEIKEINLQLGDIFQIRTIDNENKYYIEYIDTDIIKGIHTETLDKITFKINEDFRLTNEENDVIEGNITLIYRNKNKGFARQHDLLKDTCIIIYFNSKEEITGMITDLDSDMIEFTELPENNDKLYINFAYKGIPKNLNISHFKIIDCPFLPGKNEEIYKPINIKEEEFIEEIEFLNDEYEKVVQFTNIEYSKFRYDLDTQKIDLLNDLLSKIPINERTIENLYNVHINIERFQQLRRQFSHFDEYNNIENEIKKGPQWKPLIFNLKTFKQKLFWLLPITTNNKNVYNIDEESLREYININLKEDPETSLKVIIDNYKSSISSKIRSEKYIDFLKKISDYFRPFEYSSNTINILENIHIESNTNVIINNDDFNSNVVKVTLNKKTNDSENEIQTKKFVNGLYITDNKILDATKITGSKMFSDRITIDGTGDEIQLLSILTLPEVFVQFSRVNLPGTNILDKIRLSSTFIEYDELFHELERKNKIITKDFNVNNLDDEEKLKIEQDKLYKDKYIYKTLSKNYRVQGKINDISDIYNKYLNLIIPPSKKLFNLVKEYIHGKMSVYDAVSYLEPFMIYSDDITFKFFQSELIPFIFDKIKQYLTSYRNHEFLFNNILLTAINKINKKIEPVIIHNISQYNDIIEIYNITKTSNHPTISELLNTIIISDFGNVYNNGLVLKNLKLLVHSELNDMIEKENEKLVIGRDSENCIKYSISKEYKNEEDMRNDFNKNIYFDKKFDTTEYSIFEDKNGDIEKDVINAQNQLQGDELLEFFKRKLSKKGIPDGKLDYMAETIMNNNKKVREGDLSIIYENEKVKYYKRENDEWSPFEIDETAVYATDSNELLCNFREKCMEDSKNECLPMTSISTMITKNNLSKMLSEFDKKIDINIDVLEEKIKEDYNYYLDIVHKIIEIHKYNNIGKYEKIKQKISEQMKREMNIENIVISPYLKLRDAIFGIPDFSIKQRDIVRFKEEFTIDPINNIDFDKYWYYCIKTNTKLLPKFLYDLAYVYINDKDKYQDELEKIIRTQGKQSDDKNSWVDEHSGYIICKINFEDDLYNTSRADDSENIGIEGIIENDENIELTIRPYMRYENYSKVIEVLNVLIENMNLNHKLDTSVKNDFIVNIVYQQMKQLKINKKDDKYKIIILTNIIFYTVSTLLISLQTNIPTIKSDIHSEHYTFTMDDYPINPDGNMTAVTYMITIMKTVQYSWNKIYNKLKIDDIKSKIVNCIQNIVVNQSCQLLIDQRKQSKLIYLINPQEEKEEKLFSEYNIDNWTQFLPPLSNIDIKHVSNLTPEVKEELNQSLKKGENIQFDYIHLLQGKIILFSMGIQKEIQDVVDSNELILKSSSNKIYLENSCCSTKEAKSVIQYFIDKNKNKYIEQYIDNIYKISILLYDIYNITQSPFLFCKENTSNTYPQISDVFTEKTIYMAFISYCKFQTLKPLNDKLKSLCKCSGKPNILFDINDNIQNKIIKLNENGIQYTYENLIELLQYIGEENTINITINQDKFIQPIDYMKLSLSDIVHEKQLEEEPEEPHSDIYSDIENMFIIIDKNIEENQSLLKDNLYEINEKLNEIISNRIIPQSKISKKISKSGKPVKQAIINELLLWKNNISQPIYFIKHYIYFISFAYPNMLKNIFLTGNTSEIFENIIPNYIKLTPNDMKQLEKQMKQFYSDFSELNKYVSDTNKDNIDELLTYIQTNKIIIKINKIMNSTPILTMDDDLTIFLYQFYFLSTLYIYIYIIDSYDFNPEHKDQLISFINELLFIYVKMCNKNKSMVNYNYKEVYNIEFKMKETEKNMVTDRLKSKTIDERKIDSNFKSLKIGMYAKGNIKQITKYGELDENDKKLVDILEEREREIKQDDDNNLEDILYELNQNTNVADEVESDGEHGDADEDEYYDDYEYDENIERENDDPDR
jgi:hypothetical protein